ncbi:MAG: Enoyl-CoA hydratase/isomerase [Acidimicrobiia bacterium]|nr:Enoyl-CoA hydratase/isomerase [Acidimicrobiia bacterium]
MAEAKDRTLRPMADDSGIRFQVDGTVATLTFDRPERLNAFDGPMIERAIECLESVIADATVGAVIITGAGRGFCAGGDLQLIQSSAGTIRDVDGQIASMRQLEVFTELLHCMPKVTIAAINGPCAGAGLSFAAAVDLRYAAASAVFAAGFLKAGQTGDYGISWSLPRLIGAGRARELLLVGDRIDASTAHHYGLVSAVFPDAELIPAVTAIAERIAAAPASALALLKQNLVDSETSDLSGALDHEAGRLIRNLAGQG